MNLYNASLKCKTGNRQQIDDSSVLCISLCLYAQVTLYSMEVLNHSSLHYYPYVTSIPFWGMYFSACQNKNFNPCR